MHDLVAITALGGAAPRVDTVGPVTCTEVPDVALASVAARLGQEAKARTALAQVIGAPVPDNQRIAGGEKTAFWSGPDQWMVEAPYEGHQDLADQVKATVGNTASVTEQTDAWVRFDLRGDGIPSVLELLSQLDLRRLSSGTAARCSIHHVGCYLLCRDADHYSIYGPRSSAGSLHHAVLTSMRSVY
ncbi:MULTISPECIES: sarcosine oxidase subunit gamma [unclassified Ruegeria]|uniref:sarcosine oxidase subunit gamma n=1 Tax=unclassified Ruegeria TaxID=2625375 RepID=UPI001AD96A4E|nr:sarcosine oxidase subunit gamma [Ruegeria sp. R8_1]MBO9416749.1 sarcosine oxidase subunit gamma [Ruegeria sp. R8_2]